MGCFDYQGERVRLLSAETGMIGERPSRDRRRAHFRQYVGRAAVERNAGQERPVYRPSRIAESESP